MSVISLPGSPSKVWQSKCKFEALHKAHLQLLSYIVHAARASAMQPQKRRLAQVIGSFGIPEPPSQEGREATQEPRRTCHEVLVQWIPQDSDLHLNGSGVESLGLGVRLGFRIRIAIERCS